MPDPTKQPGLRIAQIILVGCHFSHREDFLSVSSETKPPESTVDVSTQVLSDPSGKVAAIAVGVQSTPDPKAAYQFGAELLAIVAEDPGQENFQPLPYVLEAGATLLYPFIREVVANLTMRGKFGPIWLKPFNVRMAVQQMLTAAEKSGATEAPAVADSPARTSSRKKRRQKSR